MKIRMLLIFTLPLLCGLTSCGSSRAPRHSDTRGGITDYQDRKDSDWEQFHNGWGEETDRQVE